MYFELETLEFPKVLNQITQYASISLTKERLLALEPLTDYTLVMQALNETEEMRKYLISFGSFPFGGIQNIKPYVSLAKKGGLLDAPYLVMIGNFINTTNQIRRIKKALGNQFSFAYLHEYMDNLYDLSNLSKEIFNVVNEQGYVMDQASKTLADIRRAMKQEETRLRNKLQDLLVSKAKELSDNVIVVRDDRLCLAVRAEYKNSFQGIIHDESSSGATVYMEPFSTFEINNRLMNLANDEKQEINRLLSDLSQKVGAVDDELNENFENIVLLDLISAKALYAKENDAIIPEINQDGIISLKKAYHPLLNRKTAVPLDIKMGVTYKTVIITGPNTGGKTVSLKTIGLLTIMMQAGILIPAQEAKMALFDNVFCDIGDEQSIEQSLSTFSSHMKKIVNITKKLTINSLILLDELGGGTDPEEGSALAIALLNYFMERDARCVITTHYPTLKAYGYLHDDICNASMEFNETTYMPTYRLLLGISGKSNAFLISKHLGLADKIIEKAQDIKYENASEVSLLMKKMEEEGLRLDRLIQENEEIKHQLQKQNAELTAKQQELASNEEKILAKAQKKADDLYATTKEKATDLLKEIESLLSEQTKEHQIATVKHKIKELKAKEELEKDSHELKVGDFVKVIPYQCLGQIERINHDKYVVKFGNLTQEFKDFDLKFSYEAPKPSKTPRRQQMGAMKNVKATLDLRGYRYEEAEDALEKFIDDAIYAHLNQVTIIHGFGTGAIRECVQKFLKKSPYIKSFRYGGEGEGLNGATIATLK